MILNFFDKFYYLLFKAPILSHLFYYINEFFIVINLHNYYKELNSYIIELTIGGIIFILTIIFGLESNDGNKTFKKKYIIMIYCLITLYSLFIDFSYNMKNSAILILIIFSITIVSGLNIKTDFGMLEKELGYFSLIYYSFWAWLLESKIYISLFLIIKLYFMEFINFSDGISNLKYAKEIIYLVNIFLFLLINLTVDVKDRFSYSEFNKLGNELKIAESRIKEIGVEYNFNKKDLLEPDLLEMLGFLLYVEDKDYFQRRKFTYSPITALRRKIMYEKCWKQIKNYLKKIKRINKDRLKRRVGGTIRGYSTIGQQVVRRVVMGPYSYDYRFRRKIFIERIYLRKFIKAYRNKKIKDKQIDKNILNYLGLRGREKYDYEKIKSIKRKNLDKEIKLEFLIYYFIKISGNPKYITELFSSIERESIQTIETLVNKNNTYTNSYFKTYIESEISNIFEQLWSDYMDNNKYLFKYDSNNKEIFIEDNNKLISLEKMASKPKKFNNKIAYIYPFDFETRNEIYVYDLMKNKKQKIYKWKENYSPKDIEWFSENLLLVLLGPTYGTVNIGGDLYMLNINSGEIELIKKFPKYIQITQIKMLDNNNLEIKGIEYIDEYMNDKQFYADRIKL